MGPGKGAVGASAVLFDRPPNMPVRVAEEKELRRARAEASAELFSLLLDIMMVGLVEVFRYLRLDS